MRLTTAEVAAIGLITTLAASMIPTAVARREARRQRKHEWATRAADAYSRGRAAWSLCGETNLSASVGAGEGAGLVAPGATEKRLSEVRASIDSLRAVAATCASKEDSHVPHEIARRLWLLSHAMVTAHNIVRVRKPGEDPSPRLAPLEEQAKRATSGTDGEGVKSRTLEVLFEDFEDQIRRTAQG